MKELTLNGKRVLLVDAKSVKDLNILILNDLEWDWHSPFLASEATEEQAKDIVQLWATNLPFYRNYQWPLPSKEFHYYEQATESLHSLILSHNMKPETTAIVPEK